LKIRLESCLSQPRVLINDDKELEHVGIIESTQFAVGADSRTKTQINVTNGLRKRLYTSIILAQVCLEQLGDLGAEEHLHFVGGGSGPNHTYLHVERLNYVLQPILKLASLCLSSLLAMLSEQLVEARSPLCVLIAVDL
jgi:hypothetical protein